MRVSLYALSLALSPSALLVYGIPAPSRDAGEELVPRANHSDDGLLVRDPFLLDERAVGMTWAAAQLAVSAEFKTKPQAGTMRFGAWKLKSQCTKCKGNQATDKTDQTKCRNCPDKTKPNEDHTECVRADTGCPDDQVQGEDKKCSKCPAGQAPETTGKKCVPSRPDKAQGKCPDHQILDPEVGGQDANTDNPKCIGDDDQKCPPGQSALTRRGKDRAVPDEAKYEPTCGADDDPDHACPDPDTFDYRDMPTGSDFKVRHSCRATEKKQSDKKATYGTRAKQAIGVRVAGAKARAAKAARSRSGWCWVALAGAGAWPADQSSSLSDDELDGMVNSWDESVPTPPGDGQIPDYVVRYTGAAIRVDVSLDASGPGGLATTISDGIKGSVTKFFGASVPDGQVGLTALKAGARGPASSKAIEAAKNSKFVQQVLKHDGYRDCLATVAATGLSASLGAIGSRDVPTDPSPFPANGQPAPGAPTSFGGSVAIYDIDWTRQPDLTVQNNPMPPNTENQAIVMSFGENTDDMESNIRTYPDNCVRVRRIPYERCFRAWSSDDNIITDLSVDGGCCSFYNGENCESDTKLFSMTNRQDGDLRGASNDAISSWWCTFDLGCTGNP